VDRDAEPEALDPVDPDAMDAGYTLDALARASGVPERSIRFYRQSGLIDPPRRVGRFAFYDRDQLTRLRLIVALRSRGLGLDGVAKVLNDPSGEHRSFTSLLEIRDELLEPWIDDRSAVLTGEEILAMVGTHRQAALGELLQYGLISPDGDDFSVPSVSTLEMAAQLMAAGVEAQVAATAWGTMQLHTAALADALVALFVDRSDYGFAGPPTAEGVAAGFRELRAVALRAVQVAFAHEIERSLQDYIAESAADINGEINLR
jgi:DNA-binding transcriptional MerR regulator